MKAYKHINSIWAEEFENGLSYQVGTHDSYKSGASGRADLGDGQAIITVNRFVSTGTIDNDSRSRLENAGVNLSTGFRVQMANNTFVRHSPPGYLFCASLEPDYSRIAHGEVIFEITNLKLFARALFKASKGYLRHPEIKAVTYKVRTGDAFDPEPISADPFTKAPEYAFEREVRVRFPVQQVGEPRIKLPSKKAASYVRRLRLG